MGQFGKYEDIRKLQGRIETLRDVFASAKPQELFLHLGHFIIILLFDISFFFLETYTIFDCTRMY